MLRSSQLCVLCLCCILPTYIGEDLLKALENGVSQYPKLEGRFPQVIHINKNTLGVKKVRGQSEATMVI